MTSVRKPKQVNVYYAPLRLDGRYVRFSHRFNTWQVQNPDKTWRNVRPFIAQCYVAAGFPVGVQPPARVRKPEQLELF